MADSLSPVVFVGGGGHAAVCLDVFRSAGRDVLGYLAPEASALDLPYLGSDDDPLAFTHRGAEAFVAIGDNRVRLRICRRLAEGGVVLATAVSAHAVMSPSASIGAGSVVMPGAVVNARTTIGHAVIVNTSASIDHDGVIADGVHVAPGSHLAGTVTVGEGTFLGAGTIVIPGMVIGAWSTVGAGGVVVRDLDDARTFVGVPARPLHQGDH